MDMTISLDTIFFALAILIYFFVDGKTSGVKSDLASDIR